MTRPSRFGVEFKKNAVNLVRSTGRSCADVARELNVNRETLRTWVRNAPDAKAHLAHTEREELAQLREQVAILKTEKETLRRAAAYFAREMAL
ncbi:transposase [Streptosporangium sp. NPDC002524]|uniref:transposase n=1 Tax=unclassified Streptosporangium TaxID=2632669 RepID=UPI00331E4B7C